MNHRKIDDQKLLEMVTAGKKGVECAAFFGVSSAAITKRLKLLQPPPKSLETLTPKEQKFCVEIANGKTQTEAALNSFECGSRESAKVIGSQLMAKPEIETAIADLMAEAGLTKRYRLQRLKQHVDDQRADISLKALDQSWKLDGSYQNPGQGNAWPTSITLNVAVAPGQPPQHIVISDDSKTISNESEEIQGIGGN